MSVLSTSGNLGRGGFNKNESDNYKFKVPQLCNLKEARFYGHGSSFRSVREVIEYKNSAISSNNHVPESSISNEFIPLELTDKEMEELTDFIENGLADPELERYEPSFLPSGNCFPNNDPKSKTQIFN